MNKICIIYPYIGKLNNYFNLWLNSARKNTFIDFLILTNNDLAEYDLGTNIKFISMTLEEIKTRAEKYFGFPVNLNRPYKLCDFKTFYCYIFEDIIKGYLYWGYGDLDVIFGDLFPLYNMLLKNNYDSCFECGHLQLIKNIPSVNNAIYSKINLKKIKKVLNDKRLYAIDEFDYARSNILKNTYINNELIADVCIFAPDLQLYSFNTQNLVMHYSKGKLFGYYLKDNQLVKKEFIYCHLQKRKMSNFVTDKDNFYITPTSFVHNGSELNNSFVSNLGKKDDALNKLYKKKYHMYLIYRCLHLIFIPKKSCLSFRKWLFKKRQTL